MALLIPGDQMPTAGSAQVPWWIEPYIPREGIVFLYGKKGVGKSPLTWSLARSIALGKPWLGLPIASKGTVLYIEVDSPLSVVKARTDKMVFPGNIFFYFPDDPILCAPEGYRKLVKDTEHVNPDVVIINTLRKIHIMEDTKSNTVSRIYAIFRKLWPCVIFVHHEKKTPANPEHVFGEGEEFSGSLAWHNDANVCLHLRHSPGVQAKDGTQSLQLLNSGNQLTAKAAPLRLTLDTDGFTLKTKPISTP